MNPHPHFDRSQIYLRRGTQVVLVGGNRPQKGDGVNAGWLVPNDDGDYQFEPSSRPINPDQLRAIADLIDRMNER
ncbi:hypothetical protein GCG21_08785 [Pseudactinotalea sp. HY160]|uniref:hypothetical protein n=1 Tax=Pseudactinotalea sp. HY160 TaxID=2654490 RepID=UPI00128B70FC|nr:hypothetical protein [Pseudactinotalea sp. HY160]MPV50100.1 hypothetical protein [Pseudactinotalea sp. HY160]